MNELSVELAHQVGMLEDHLGHIGSSLQVASALKLEQVTLGADDGADAETLEEAG